MSDLKLIGKSVLRRDGPDKTTGKARYTADRQLPGMLICGILRSPHPHAKILNIDCSRAEKLPGVKAIISGKDTLGIKHGFVETPRYPPDQNILASDTVRHVGEEVAAVAAINQKVLDEALDLIEVKYEILPAVFDVVDAMNPDCEVQIHPNHPRVNEPFCNIAGKTETQWGDVEKGFSQADLICSDRFESHLRTHGYLEPQTTLADYNADGTLHLWISSMGPFVKRRKLAKALGMPYASIQIHKAYVGGAFGGKIDLFSHEYCAAALSIKTARPVKFVSSREDVFAAYRHGQPLISEIKTGLKKDGTIVAQQLRMINNAGAYKGSGVVVIFLAWAFSMIPYRVENFKYEGYSIFSNNPPRAPLRGHGAPQVRFALESHMDIIAEKLQIDPIEFRLKNARVAGEELPNRDSVHNCGLQECIQKAVLKTDFIKRRHPFPKFEKPSSLNPLKRGIGLGVSSYFGGSLIYPNSSSAIVKMADDGSVDLLTGAIEMGQGSETVLCQIVGEELQLEMADIRITSADTATTPHDIGAWISGLTYVTGNAVRQAAGSVRDKILKVAAEQLHESVANLTLENKFVFVTTDPERRISYQQIFEASVGTHRGDTIIGEGHWRTMRDEPFHPSLASTKGRWSENYAFSAQVAEVEVDTETGEIKLLKATTVHDCGFPINPQLVKGQIDGQVSLALGHAFMEDVMLKNGYTLNPTWLDYRMPLIHNVADSKDVDVITESYQVGRSFRTKEVGEGLVSAILAAIANAIYDATGLRMYSTPFSPEKVLKGLKLLRVGSKIS
ncbi:MAG: molybdopterin-dependent oxidoreductase [Deltaproteobacteria bacterium]|nr:molybdopterin-dependent oxidoreductase [Deltaproteobacteria bacterium]MBT4637352.1 molybdopterin-dependent oxidoreductase [Deltaproteobacteria bacterium]MBT7713329.1 molybdopterin-dependent oxidoreductase [Deltaproteobacteria bacterium]